MAFVSVQKIRFDDVDGAGIVYYPRFFHMCHKAFEDFFDTQGPCTYPKLISEWRRGFPTVKTQGDYKGPLRYGDTALVSLWIERIGSSSMDTGYQIARQSDGAIVFVGKVTTVCVDMNTFRPTPLQGELLEFLQSAQKMPHDT